MSKPEENKRIEEILKELSPEDKQTVYQLLSIEIPDQVEKDILVKTAKYYHNHPEEFAKLEGMVKRLDNLS